MELSKLSLVEHLDKKMTTMSKRKQEHEKYQMDLLKYNHNSKRERFVASQ